MSYHGTPLENPSIADTIEIGQMQGQLTTLLLEVNGTLDHTEIDTSQVDLDAVHALGWCGCIPCGITMLGAVNLANLTRWFAAQTNQQPMDVWAQILNESAQYRATHQPGDTTP